MKATIELKELLIHRINEINDMAFLRAIKTILDSKIEAEFILLTPGQKREIMASREEVSQGHFTDSESLDKEMQEWANIK